MLRLRQHLSVPALAGALFLFAGARDLFAPGFLSISSRTPGADEAAVYVIIGVMFIAAARAPRKKAALGASST